MNTVLFTKVSRLHHAVRDLNPKTKKALYSSAMGNVFQRSTWNGCALNQASGGQVKSYSAGAEYFGESEANMVKFVAAWDSFPNFAGEDKITQEQQTMYLIDVIEQVGLETSPVEAKSKKFTFQIDIKKSESELDSFLNSLSNDEIEEVLADSCNASELLFANV